jgi:simple sugar transport system ATP-binding protein
MLNAGIAMVHQHFMLVPTLSVVENVVLGNMRPFRPKLSQVAARIRAMAGELGFEIDPYAKVGSLTVGARQRVEIVKALYCEVKVLILDEPTAVLTPGETGDLLVMLRRLAQSGISILFISHKFDEVLTVSDRISVMRRGELVSTLTKDDFDDHQLAQLMTGRDVVFCVELKTKNRALKTSLFRSMRGRCSL